MHTLAVRWAHFVCGTCIQWPRLFVRLPVLEARKMGIGATHRSNKSAACTCHVHGESILYTNHLPIDLWSECRWITEKYLSLWQLECIIPLTCLIYPPVSVVNAVTWNALVLLRLERTLLELETGGSCMELSYYTPSVAWRAHSSNSLVFKAVLIQYGAKIARKSKIHNTSGDTVSGCGPACTSLMSQSH